MLANKTSSPARQASWGSKKSHYKARFAYETLHIPRDNTTVRRLLAFIGMTVGGAVGWWVGEYLVLGFVTTFLVSSLGSLVGVYGAWWIMRDYLD